MSRAKLFLLGSPRIEYEGVPIEVDTRKAVAVLAYLAVTQQYHSREALAALFWPEYDQSQARAVLRRTLSALSRARAEGWLDVGRQSIGLNRSKVWVDVDHFTNLLAECRTHGHPEAEVCTACLSPLIEAASLYRGDFLAGFSVRGSVDFDDWQFLEAQSLERKLSSALQKLAHLHSALGEFERAIEYARRLLALDPLHEPAHRSLMELYVWAGQRAAAVRQYRECVRIFEQELGVSPLEETTRLYQEIKENQAPPLPVAPQSQPLALQAESSPPPPLREASPTIQVPGNPLVGRSAEWAALLRSYEAAGVNGHVMILEGEAGIGKTRLAEELLAHLRVHGAVALAARCYVEETTLAYGPFVELLGAAIGQPRSIVKLERLPVHVLSEAARLLPELASLRPELPSAPPLGTPGAQSRFFEGISQVLLAVCGSTTPGILFFDDLHWADAASLDLLAYLVRRLRGRPLYVLATWRSEQMPVTHRLRALLVEARRSGTATFLPLPRLSRSAVAELVQSIAESEAWPGELGERLYDETEGLPFLLEEYLTAIAQGELTIEDDVWLLPGGVRDLLHGRLQAIGETGWQLLNTAAVIGRSFDFDTVREASGRSEEETVTALEELISQGLIQEVRAQADEGALIYDFSHEKLRTLVYEETSLARRRLLHRRVATAFARRPYGSQEIGPLAGQIAHHYRLAGQEAEAADYFKLAGEHARGLYANAEALAHFHAALALGHPDTAALHEAIGDLHTLLGDYSAALASYETAAALGDPTTLAGVEHKLGIVYQRRGEWELAKSHLQAALSALGDSGPSSERARLYADLSLTIHHQGQTGQAVRLARQALELAEAAGDMRALVQAHNMLGILASSQSDPDTAHYHLKQSLALGEDLNDLSAQVAALNNLALVHRHSGETEQAIERTEAALALCTSVGDRHREAALHNNLADLLHAVSRSEEAMSHLKQSVEIYAEIGVEAGNVQPEIWKLTEW
jgi:DNA-binding SARP family transcriptional activator/Tfp pilus assembly protein PilF